MMADGSVCGGYIHGATDATGANVTEKNVQITDPNATIGYALSLPLDQVLYSPSKRPFTVADKGKPVLRLIHLAPGAATHPKPPPKWARVYRFRELQALFLVSWPGLPLIRSPCSAFERSSPTAPTP